VIFPVTILSAKKRKICENIRSIFRNPAPVFSSIYAVLFISMKQKHRLQKLFSYCLIRQLRVGFFTPRLLLASWPTESPRAHAIPLEPKCWHKIKPFFGKEAKVFSAAISWFIL